MKKHLNTELICVTQEQNVIYHWKNDQVRILGWKFLAVSRLGRDKKQKTKSSPGDDISMSHDDHEQHISCFSARLPSDKYSKSFFLYYISYNKKGCCT